MADNCRVLKNGRFVFPDKIVEGTLVIDHGKIHEFFEDEDRYQTSNYYNNPNYKETDLEGAFAGPGFIDVHVHGGGGGNVMDGELSSFRKMAKTHGQKGTTRFLLTTVTASHEKLMSVCSAAKTWMETIKEEPYNDGAKPLGIHLEGPYINIAKKGAQNGTFVRDFSMGEVEELQQQSGDTIKLITLAPEKLQDYSVITKLSESGIIVSTGHTEATFDEIKRAFEHGATHITHLCNAMPSIHHRNPGPITFALTQDGLTAEIIADGLHVHPEVIRLVLQAKRREDVMIVTDAIQAAGEKDGEYNLEGLKVTVKEGKATLEDGTLAGSCLHMEKALQFLQQSLQLDLPLLFTLMSTNPAKMLGIEHQFGTLDVGKMADIVILKENNVEKVMVEGQWI